MYGGDGEGVGNKKGRGERRGWVGFEGKEGGR